MPRKAREESATGIYHVMIRGINRQDIFETPEDYRKFIETEPCNDSDYFVVLMRYIHQNSVKAGLAKTAKARPRSQLQRLLPRVRQSLTAAARTRAAMVARRVATPAAIPKRATRTERCCKQTRGLTNYESCQSPFSCSMSSENSLNHSQRQEKHTE